MANIKLSLAALAAATVVVATPTPSKTLVERGTFCDQWGSETTGAYTVYNNLWGQDAADSGSQCTTNNGISNGALSWSTEWTWSGGPYNVKSYANVVTASDKVSLDSISTIQSSWSWTYTGDGIVANVAYDLFTGSSADGSAEYEFMIWLGALGGAGPISSSGSPIATPNISGTSWNLYNGQNGNMNVFSFVAASNVENFSGDLMDFVSYLRSDQGVSGSQILQSVGAGTEPFGGSNAVFTTSAYSASVN